MACPYFYPTERIPPGFSGGRARLPLGDLFAGRCCADPASEFAPGESLLRECCNLGYARRRCPRFPKRPGPDAVRFAVAAGGNSSLRILYAVEQDHLPHDSGALDYDPRLVLLNPPPDPVLARQAESFAGSYLRRRPP